MPSRNNLTYLLTSGMTDESKYQPQARSMIVKLIRVDMLLSGTTSLYLIYYWTGNRCTWYGDGLWVLGQRLISGWTNN